MGYRVDALQITKHIGNTPLYEAEEDGRFLWIKLEGNNPGGSAKDRAAWGMLRLAEKEGKLRPKSVIVEPTSGNTGISLAMLGSGMGLRVILTMPESMSKERRQILKAFGAELVLTPAAEGMNGAVEAASRLVEEIPGAFMPDQFSNPGNAWAHQVTTGPELLTALKGRTPAAFVAGVGTGGTLTGIARSLKAAFPDVEIVAVEPAKSPLLSGGPAGPHGIMGIGANFVPSLLDRSLVDRVVLVGDEEAYETTRELAAKRGLFCGISTGANVWAARKVAREHPEGSLVLTIAVDRGDRYLSTPAYE